MQATEDVCMYVWRLFFFFFWLLFSVGLFLMYRYHSCKATMYSYQPELLLTDGREDVHFVPLDLVQLISFLLPSSRHIKRMAER